MTNDLTQHGTGNIGVQNVANSTVNITQILANSYDYKNLTNQLEINTKLFARTPEDETQERLEISQNIAQLESQITQFKQDVLRLAEEFNRIEINTDRLRRAKEHFEKGEIAAARAVFDSEHEQMQDENDRLVKEKAHFEKAVQPKLKHNSEEFYMRALLEHTAYDNPNWLNDTCDYFERSINAFASEENVFEYATFLHKHNYLDEAEVYYQKCLSEFINGDQLRRAKTLNQLAILHRIKNQLTQSHKEYAETLEIYRKFATVNPSVYLPDVALTLNNWANLHVTSNELLKAEVKYKEALVIRRKFASINPAEHLRYVANTLTNLASLHAINNQLHKAKTKYNKALKVYRDLAAANSFEYLPYVALTLNNLAGLYFNQGEFAKCEEVIVEAQAIYKIFATLNPATYLPNIAKTLINSANLHNVTKELEQAEAEYHKALEIYRELAAVNPFAYLPDVATTLIDFANYHLESITNRERSIAYAMEAVMVLLLIVEDVPHIQKYLQTAIAVLQEGWGLSEEEIQQMLTEK